MKPTYTDLQAAWILQQVDKKLSELPSGEEGKSAYEIAVENGFEGTEAEWLESLKGEKGDPGGFANFTTDETLTLSESGVLSVNVADTVEDNTLPISAAAVNTTVGNIEVLLATI